jgi:hypothetical protein
VGKVAERLAEGIRMGWREHDEFQQRMHGGGSVLGDREEEDRAMQLKKRRVLLGLWQCLLCRSKGRGSREDWAWLHPERRTARWRSASASGEPWHARGTTPGKGYGGGRSRGDAWGERERELNGGEGRTVTRGKGLRRRQSRSRGSRGCAEEEEGEKKPATDLKILESSRVFQKTKNPH